MRETHEDWLFDAYDHNTLVEHEFYGTQVGSLGTYHTAHLPLLRDLMSQFRGNTCSYCGCRYVDDGKPVCKQCGAPRST